MTRIGASAEDSGGGELAGKGLAAQKFTQIGRGNITTKEGALGTAATLRTATTQRLRPASAHRSLGTSGLEWFAMLVRVSYGTSVANSVQSAALLSDNIVACLQVCTLWRLQVCPALKRLSGHPRFWTATRGVTVMPAR